MKLYKESQTKKKKDKSTVTELGTIDLPMHQLVDGVEMEKWYILVYTHTHTRTHTHTHTRVCLVTRLFLYVVTAGTTWW